MAIQWRPIDAPDFRSAAAISGQGAELLTGAVQGLTDLANQQRELNVVDQQEQQLLNLAQAKANIAAMSPEAVTSALNNSGEFFNTLGVQDNLTKAGIFEALAAQQEVNEQATAAFAQGELEQQRKLELEREKASLKPAKYKVGTKYDEQGREQKFIYNENDPTQIYDIGGSKLGKGTSVGTDGSQPQTVKLSTTAEKQLENAYDASSKAESTASKAYELANRVDRLAQEGGWKSGILGSATESFRNVFGIQGDISEAKQQYRQFYNDQVIGALPPGVATDADIRIFSSGFPDDSWEPSKLSSWLRGQAKAADVVSARERFKADYIGRYGNLGAVDGITFAQAWENSPESNQLKLKYTPAPTIEGVQPTSLQKTVVNGNVFFRDASTNSVYDAKGNKVN